MYKFVLNETSYHGTGSISAVPEEIKARGFKKVFTVTDPDEGKIVGKGTHEELLKTCEQYREIAYSQLEEEV